MGRQGISEGSYGGTHVLLNTSRGYVETLDIRKLFW